MVFEKLNMHATKERNGILIYLRIASREICVLGDEGIHQFVGQEYWDTVIQEMIQTIKNESLANGIVKGIELIGKQLSIYFPATEINPNELSNEISHD